MATKSAGQIHADIKKTLQLRWILMDSIDINVLFNWCSRQNKRKYILVIMSCRSFCIFTRYWVREPKKYMLF